MWVVMDGFTIIFNTLLTRSLALLVFFGFGLLFLPSERNPLGNFWVWSNSGFVRIFWIWFVVFAESTRELSGSFELWVCSKFGFVCILWIWFFVFAERAEATQKLLGLFELWVSSKFGFLHISWIWFVYIKFGC